MASEQALKVGQSLSRVQARRLFARVLFRSLAGVVVLLTLYYFLPFQDLRGVPVWICLLGALVLLAAVIVAQVRGIVTSRYPGVYAVEALAVTVPFFLLMFASAYLVLAQDNAANFSTHQLTRTDSLYFVLTTFATVGFGDITATSQTARVLVMAQMILDLVALGLGVQVYRGAVQVGRRRSGAGAGSRPPDKDVPGQSEGIQP
jgi:cytochrome c oxidase subunit IV